MSDHIIANYRRMTKDGEVQRGPTLFFGIIVKASQTNETTKIYSCPDANDMYLFATFSNPSKYTSKMLLEYPVYFDEGLYVDLGDNVSELVVLYSPLAT